MSERYWSENSIIYTDGSFEVLWGRWGNSPDKCLGVHWCKSEESYPCPKLYGGELGWLVVPSFLTMSILKELLACVMANPSWNTVGVDGIVDAIRECAEQDSK